MADIVFICPYCEQKIEAPSDLAGTKVPCPTCQCELHVPIYAEPVHPNAPTSSPPALPLGRASHSNPSPHFVAAKCPSCGGDLHVPDDREQVKCMYCGGTVIIPQAIQLASGINPDHLMELAKASADANNQQEAYDYYSRALEYDPKNSEAWFGKGKSAGWMSTVAEIRTPEMIVAFDNAIKYAPDSAKPAFQQRCAHAITTVTTACYSISRKHLEEFVRAEATWPHYVQNLFLLIQASFIARSYDQANTTAIENVIRLCADLLRGISYSSDGFGLLQKKLHVTRKSEAWLKAELDEACADMCRLTPGFVRPKV